MVLFKLHIAQLNPNSNKDLKIVPKENSQITNNSTTISNVWENQNAALLPKQ